MGGRVGERAEAPKVPAMRSIVGMAPEGGAALPNKDSRPFSEAEPQRLSSPLPVEILSKLFLKVFGRRSFSLL
jgi:hypothetical protein